MKTIIANWKMQLGVRESVSLARATLLLLRGRKITPHVVVCPSEVALTEVHKIVARSSVELGAQNVSQEESGAFTGEVSARMLVEVGVSHVIIGHSERRKLFCETDETVNKKVLRAFTHGIIPIVCVGETKQQRSAKETHAVVRRQVLSALANAHLTRRDKLLIAYEPVWAIGTGLTPTVQEIIDVHTQINEALHIAFSNIDSKSFSILYGGSVDGKNSYGFLREPLIEGLLVGGASVKIHQFGEIIDSASNTLEALAS